MGVDTSVVAVALTAASNVLFLGFIYGKVATRLDDLSRELRTYVRRTDDTILRLDQQVRDHAIRLAKLEAQRPALPGVHA